jgi:hypothetical protein
MSDDHNARHPVIDIIDAAFEDGLDPVPDHLTAAAIDAFTWRTVDTDLADLLYDSHEADLIGVRGTSTERRSFRYGAGDFVIRVHLTPATLIVMVEPPLSVGCRIRSGDLVIEHRTDELGELVTDAPELPLRVEVDLPGGTIVTPSIIG